MLFNKTSVNLLEEIEFLETFMRELDTDIEIIRKSVEVNEFERKQSKDVYQEAIHLLQGL